jgi:hypothetical protein
LTPVRVNFLIVGTQKGGTTALATLLGHHPDVRMPRTKEIHYFDFDDNFSPQGPDYDRYHWHFDDPGQRSAVGEATPIYMYWKSAPRRIAAYNPDMRLVFLLRDPVMRAWSHYQMERKRHNDGRSFSEAIRTEDERVRRAGPGQHRVFSYVDRGFYSRQIERMLEHFDRKQMLFLPTEELVVTPATTVGRVTDFLGLRAMPSMDVSLTPPTHHPPMPDADRRYLQAIYAPERDRLEALLGWDGSMWPGEV